MSKKRIKIGAMYREYGEMEGVLCRNCCNFITIAVDGKHHCKCKAYGITREANTNWRSKYEACGIDDKVTVKSMAEYMGVSEKTVRRRLKEHGGFWIDEGQIGKK